ncbi:MAG: 2-oxo-4-hydroxy-4-carboxy-5-ureidoimidazoline decarboxylase [Flavisolibacter sp.]|nr:2-oxo-4-hydroxy-4-carboxy-5-ureidoimidazoline decarboxylase [Flavisolibacter sp.]
MTLEQLNHLKKKELKEALAKCCGSATWVEKMTAIFPLKDKATLLRKAEELWFACSEEDWREAFTHHPKIGDLNSLKEKFAITSKWAEGEQSGVKTTTPQVLEQLAEGNRLYEEKFGYIFIVCATGKSAEEMLRILRSRLPNNPEEEIKIAMSEQNKITKLRLEKLLSS